MDLKAYLRALRKGWLIVVAGLIVGAAIATWITVAAVPQYSTTLTFFVSTPSVAASGSALSSDQYAQARVNSYVELLSSEALAKQINAKTQTGLSASKLASEITGSSTVNTVLLDADVIDSNPARGLQIANLVATEFPVYVQGLEARGTGATVALKVTSGPTPHSTAISPRKTLNLALGLLVGLVVGILLAILREVLDVSVRTTEALQGLTGKPVFGSVAFDAAARKSPLITGDAARSPRAEAYRQLRTNLQFVNLDKPMKVLVVTSSVANEGKSATAANLAIVFAEAGERVLLIEADLRRPRVSEYLGLERAVGLSNVVAGQAELDAVLQPWGPGGLVVLPSGTLPPNPSELLGSQNLKLLVDELAERFDHIIIDTPPIMPVTDGAVVSTLADGVILVVRQGKTSKSNVLTALRSLQAVDAKVLGCLLSMAPTKGPDAKAGQVNYDYYRGPVSSEPRKASHHSAESAPLGSSLASGDSGSA